MVISLPAVAQCPSGYTSAQLNWDAMDFLKTGGGYATYVTAGMAKTQNFAFGTGKINIDHTYTGTNNGGISTAHTGELGANGTGADVLFLGNGTITITFSNAVRNTRFAIADIDRSQRVSIQAYNGLLPVNVALSTLSTSILTVTANNTALARVDANTTVLANNVTTGTVNVSITAEITSIVLTVSNTGTVTSGSTSGQENGGFFLSDISACTNTPAFTTNYYQVAKPFTGQPGYVLMSANNMVYQVDVATGNAKFIFADASNNNINSMGYDPVNRILYYTYSLTSSPSTDKKVMKYDFNTGTISTFIPDVNTLGIPTYQIGIESGAASFYDGALYLGIEGYVPNTTSVAGRKSIVWRIPISSTGVIGDVVQAYGIPSDQTGTGQIHDWGDIGVNNGVIYDFDVSQNGSNVLHYNMQTGGLTSYNPTFTVNQTGIDYNGQIYNVGTTVSPYTGTTSVNTAAVRTIVGNPAFPASVSIGDASEAFRPKADFGDAPASYDPDPNAPAVHEVTATLRLGAATTDEWDKITSALGDGDADDGLPTPTIVMNNSNFLTNVNVYNNTGAPATVAAWVDFNSNGIFEAGEGATATVPSSASVQAVDLFWASPSNNLLPYSYTFMRIRVTSAANNLTTAKATGFFADGEVEDYRVQVNAYSLPSDLLRFDAQKAPQRRGRISWDVADEVPGSVYTLQRSTDGRTWTELQRQAVAAPRSLGKYTYTDMRPEPGVNHYRLRIARPGGQAQQSTVRRLQFDSEARITLAPNPAAGATQLLAAIPKAASGTLTLYAASGALVHAQVLRLPGGNSATPVALPTTLTAGTYLVEIRIGDLRYTDRLQIRK
ncbi:hypothetical protein GCM10023184_01850 [Flaviaesturariibacter amylovorans]|uniref:GEVED domain-containing protein n=2 Tax=Flaviaesturariibacter amylovorans TaxID=1084520 RepID=A0ABP8G5N6_9BACT